MAYNEHLAARVRNVVGSGSKVSERKMFGGLCVMHDGHMLLGVVGDDLMVRVGPEQHEECLSLPGARAMDFTGRPMKGMVFVDGSSLETDRAIAAWAERAARFVSTLPPKK